MTDPTKLPPGIILPFGGTTFGTDCLPCNGASISRTDYAELFTAIGTNFGSQDSATFRVPDLRDRAIFGVGSVLAMAQNEGASLGNRGPKHFHNFNKSVNTSSDGNHSHSVGAMVPDYEEYYGSYAPTFTRVRSGTVNTNSAGNHNHSVSVAGPTSGGGAQDSPGFLALQYVITTGISS